MSRQVILSAAESLVGDDWDEKDYSRMVSDGAAIDRLLRNKDFHVFQRRMTVELALVLRKAMMADSEPARAAAQGAMLQQLRVLKLPGDIVARAAKAVSDKRREDEGDHDAA